MSKGGRTSSTWASGSSWHHQDMKTIRIPAALEAEIMAYARTLDTCIAASHGNTADGGTPAAQTEIVLGAIAAYIELRRGNRHANQHTSKELDTSARTWDEMRKFRAIVQNEPHKLGLRNE